MVWLGTVGMLLMVASRLLYAGVDDGMVHDDNTAARPKPKQPKKSKPVDLKPAHQEI